MRSREYWRKRSEEALERQLKKADKTQAKLDSEYRKAVAAIEREVARWYVRYAEAEGITLAEAKKRLTDKELAELKMDVKEYIQKGHTLKYTQKWAKQLEAASARAHITRLEAMQLHIRQLAEELSVSAEDKITELARDIYEDGFYHTAFEIQKGVGVAWNFTRPDKKQIDKVITSPWAPDGRNFSDRVWTNKGKLISELETTFTQGIIRGLDPKKVIKTMTERLGVSRSSVARLVQTEAAYFASAATGEAFKQLGVEKYEVIATLDTRTSEICRHMDGKVFLEKDRKIGATAPPFHVWCRSTTVPYFDDEFTEGEMRAARGDDGGYETLPSDVKYEDWSRIQDQFTERAALVKRRKGEPTKVMVNYNVVNSKEYHDKFMGLTASKDTNEALYKKAGTILQHRDGTEKEDLAMLDLRTGKLLVENLSASGGKNYQCGLTTKEQETLEALGVRYVAIHNHPNSTIPSRDDIHMLFARKNAKISIAVGHNGSVYKLEKTDKVQYTEGIKILGEKIYKEVKKRYNGYGDEALWEVRTSEQLIKALEEMGLMTYQSW